jgi:hypothetical protein
MEEEVAAASAIIPILRDDLNEEEEKFRDAMTNVCGLTQVQAMRLINMGIWSPESIIELRYDELKKSFTGPAQPGVLVISSHCGMSCWIREQFGIHGDNHTVNIDMYTEEECRCATRNNAATGVWRTHDESGSKNDPNEPEKNHR